MIEINLIPDVKRELIKAQRARGVVISASIITSIAAAAAVILLVLYIFGVQAARGAILDSNITAKGDELAQVEDLSKILTIQNQLAKISELNDKKTMASRTFDIMAAITPPGDTTVAFSNIVVTPAAFEEGVTAESGASSGQIRLEGQAPSYDTMELFKKRIENTSFQYVEDGEPVLVPLSSNINASDISYGEDSNGSKVLRFTLTFDYPAELFSSKTANQQISFKLTIDGNVTDSYLGIPRFAERVNTTDEENE